MSGIVDDADVGSRPFAGEFDIFQKETLFAGQFPVVVLPVRSKTTRLPFSRRR